MDLEEMYEKWDDVRLSAEDRAERTLAEEVLEDLKEVRKWLAKN